MTTSLGRVDSHHHVWDLSRHAQPWLDGPGMSRLCRTFSVEDMRPDAVRAGITATVVVQTIHDRQETLDLLAVAESEDLVSGVVGWADLTAPDIAEELVRLREAPGGDRLVGIRHLVQDEPDATWLLRPDVLRGLRAVAGAGLVYDLLVRPPQLAAAARAVRAVPEGRFALDHVGKPPIAIDSVRPWQDLVEVLASLPNVTAKLSGLVTEARWDHWTPTDLRPYVDHALELFGVDRLCFGSDWPVCLLAAGGYGGWVAAVDVLLAALSPDEHARVMGTTARTLYRLAT